MAKYTYFCILLGCREVWAQSADATARAKEKRPVTDCFLDGLAGGDGALEIGEGQGLLIVVHHF
jgi:hypothetical protein